MAGDDKERRLPSKVERALARARAEARGERGSREGRWLALVPLVIASIFLALLMPRATTPEDIPLPALDMRALAAAENADRARAATDLPSDVRAVGSGLRAINLAQLDGDADRVHVGRIEIDAALRELFARPDAEKDLVSLRAVQIEQFLAAIAHYRRTGEESDDLRALGGSAFLRSARAVGWVRDRDVLLDEHALRVAFKIVWNGVVAGGRTLAITLDEHRAFYTFLLTHPHPSDVSLPGIDAELRGAKTELECQKAQRNAMLAAELWRIEKIKTFAGLDPDYPARYALGVAYYRAGRYDQSIDAFRAFVDQHPDGPLALRARNHLKAAVTAYGTY